MVEIKGGALVRSVESLLAEKKTVAAKEKDLIEALNTVLTKMGYQVVARGTDPTRTRGRRGRPLGRKRGRAAAVAKRGRTRMSAAARRAVSRRMKAYWAKRKAAGAKTRKK